MLTKWVVVPMALAGVGFFVLGPILEGKASAANPSSTAPPEDKPRFTSEPDVDVSVAPAAPRRSRAPRTSTRTSTSPPRAETPPPAEEPSETVPDAEPTIDHSTPPPPDTTVEDPTRSPEPADGPGIGG